MMYSRGMIYTDGPENTVLVKSVRFYNENPLTGHIKSRGGK